MRTWILVGFLILAGGTGIGAYLAGQKDQPIQSVSKTSNYHISSWVREGYYDPVFAAADSKPVAVEKGIIGAIVNHHLFAPDLIAETLHAVSETDPTLIVLISPNHFGIGKGDIITSTYDWHTMEGGMKGDYALASKLTETSSVVVDESIFAKEHGIFNELTFLKHTFPDARILPLVVREQTPDTVIDEVAKQLDELVPPSTLFIGSFDFSHYQVQTQADRDDEKSLAVLQTLDPDQARSAVVDSKKGLRLLLRLIEKREVKKFHLTGHSSSDVRTGKLESTENTTYITGYFAAE